MPIVQKHDHGRPRDAWYPIHATRTLESSCNWSSRWDWMVARELTSCQQYHSGWRRHCSDRQVPSAKCSGRWHVVACHSFCYCVNLKLIKVCIWLGHNCFDLQQAELYSPRIYFLDPPRISMRVLRLMGVFFYTRSTRLIGTDHLLHLRWRWSLHIFHSSLRPSEEVSMSDSGL